jgi:hypothetical protein
MMSCIGHINTPVPFHFTPAEMEILEQSTQRGPVEELILAKVTYNVFFKYLTPLLQAQKLERVNRFEAELTHRIPSPVDTLEKLQNAWQQTVICLTVHILRYLPPEATDELETTFKDLSPCKSIHLVTVQDIYNCIEQTSDGRQVIYSNSTKVKALCKKIVINHPDLAHYSIVQVANSEKSISLEQTPDALLRIHFCHSFQSSMIRALMQQGGDTITDEGLYRTIHLFYNDELLQKNRMVFEELYTTYKELYARFSQQSSFYYHTTGSNIDRAKMCDELIDIIAARPHEELKKDEDRLLFRIIAHLSDLDAECRSHINETRVRRAVALLVHPALKEIATQRVNGSYL